MVPNEREGRAIKPPPLFKRGEVPRSKCAAQKMPTYLSIQRRKEFEQRLLLVGNRWLIVMVNRTVNRAGRFGQQSDLCISTKGCWQIKWRELRNDGAMCTADRSICLTFRQQQDHCLLCRT